MACFSFLHYHATFHAMRAHRKCQVQRQKAKALAGGDEELRRGERAAGAICARTDTPDMTERAGSSRQERHWRGLQVETLQR